MLPFRWVSAAVLIALAVRGGVTALGTYRNGAAAARTDRAPLTPARAYATLLAITLMNPMTVVYFAALVLGSEVVAAAAPAHRAVLVLAAFAASAGWQLLIAGGGARPGRALTGSRGETRHRARLQHPHHGARRPSSPPVLLIRTTVRRPHRRGESGGPPGAVR